jgi:peptide/nickel transport system substrate-binding protein
MEFLAPAASQIPRYARDKKEFIMKRTLALLATFLVIISCKGKEGGGAAGGGKDLVIAFDSSPTNLDSRVGNSQVDGRVQDLVYAGLMKATTKGDFEPDIAESVDTPDPLTLVFHLRPNLTFHDGKPLTSKDVKFTYDSLMADSFQTPKKSGYSTVTAFEAPDDRTFIIKLKEPNAGIFDNLTLGILPQGADTNVFKSKPNASGPYKVREFRPDESVELEAFDGYHGGAPNIKRVVARVIPDATTRVLELRQGSVNFGVNVVPYDQVEPFKQNKDFKVIAQPGAIYQYLAFNLRDPILRKKQVRQAIAHAVDRERIVRDLLLGYGKVTDSMLPEGHWARAEGLPSNAYNVAEAKKLLDQAGHRDPDGDGPRSRFKLVYKTSTDAEANQQAEMVQQMLKQVGIDVEIVSSELGKFLEDVQQGNFQLFSLRRAGVADPDFYNVIFHSKSIPPEGQNRGFYINPKVDQLIQQGRSTFDREERKRIYAELQKILAEDLPYLSLYHRFNVAITRDYLDGFQMYPSGFLLSIPKMTAR